VFLLDTRYTFRDFLVDTIMSFRDYYADLPRTNAPNVEFFNRWDPAVDITVLYAGFQICISGHLWKGIRNHALIHHVVKGRGRVRLHRQEWTIGPGDSFLFYPHNDLWYEADRVDPWSYLWIGIGGAKVTQWLDMCGFSDARPVLRAREGSDPTQRCIDLLEAVEREQSGDFSHPARIQALLFSLLDSLSPGTVKKAPSNSKTSPYIPEIIEFLNQAYSRKITTGIVANFAGLERTYCSHLFSQTMGISLMQYLTDLRMRKALELLKSTNLSVRAVAESVGYSDAGLFAKRFKAEQGFTPSEARRARS
jgi:AraC-like DNA-binding protein